ncbi:S9 family peptidase [Natronorarus salvus]|uniref:S9 family peptidase n=1 Tax=Natronorarus salvus TaxID=3117733 RepID=UPI002F263EFE
MRTYDLKRYLTARATTQPSFTPDGTLAFLSDATGTPQLWTVSEPGAWPVQRTHYDERMSFVDASPTREEVMVGMDRGSDEHDQLLLVDCADSAVEEVTDDPEVIHTWGGWHPDGERFAFAANRREYATFDVYVGDREGGERLVTAEGGGRLSVEGFSPDGSRLAVTEAHGSDWQEVSVLDAETGERVQVSEGEFRYENVSWAPDGSLYATSDRHSDHLALVRLGDEVEPVIASEEWGIEHAAIGSGGEVAYAHNVDGYSVLHVGELTDPIGVEAEEVDLPRGVIEGLSIERGRGLVTLSTPSRPSSVYVVDVGTGDGQGTIRWTHPSTAGIPESQFQSPEIVRYDTFDGREIPAYLTFPREVSEGGAPVIVDIHGGPQHQQRPWFNPVKQSFLDSGYAVFEPNVRGSSGYGREYTQLDDVEKRMDSVTDIRYGVRWLGEQPEIDGERTVAYGRSYGGFMVLAAITEYPELWAAAVEFVGIGDFVTFLENTSEWRRSHREREYGSLAEDREVLEEISPLRRIDRVACPLFVQHGANDPRVPVSEAEAIAESLSGKGIPVETCIFEDEGHHTTSLENRIEQFERIAAFLEEHVGGIDADQGR